MKKIFILTILLVGIISSNTAFAQSGTSIVIDYRYNAVLEFFLQKTQEKDYQTAYEQMHGTFQKVYPLDTFKNIISETGLDTFTSKKWISAEDKMADIGVATIVGEFTMPDNTVHQITFPIILQGSDIKIGNIVETITIADLAKRFPQAGELTKLIQKDLKSLAGFIKKNQAKPLLKYLSKLGQTRTKIIKIRKVMRPFRKLNMTMPKKAVLALMEGSPTLNEQGMMVVQGSYQNNKNRIDFTLAYDYEWQWKLGGFTLSATPIGKGTTTPAGINTPSGTSTPAQ